MEFRKSNLHFSLIKMASQWDDFMEQNDQAIAIDLGSDRCAAVLINRGSLARGSLFNPEIIVFGGWLGFYLG
jgi:hypothetical protein